MGIPGGEFYIITIFSRSNVSKFRTPREIWHSETYMCENCLRQTFFPIHVYSSAPNIRSTLLCKRCCRVILLLDNMDYDTTDDFVSDLANRITISSSMLGHNCETF